MPRRNPTANQTTRLPLQADALEEKRVATDAKKELFLTSLRSTLGILSHALDSCAIPRSTYTEWFENDPVFRARVMDIGERAVDFSETALLKKIKDGDTKAIIFHLKTKGKSRGYVEHVQVTGKDGGPIHTESVLTIEQVNEELPESAIDGILKRLFVAGYDGQRKPGKAKTKDSVPKGKKK